MDSKYFSSIFIVRYFHIFVLSPYLLYVGFKINKFDTTNSTILMFLGAFAALYNYLVLYERSEIIQSIIFLILYLVVLISIYNIHKKQKSNTNI